jgi:hypothetical protein
MPNHEEFMAEMRHDLSEENIDQQPVSPPALSMRNPCPEEMPAPKKQKPKCHRINHTSWRGGAQRR